MIDPVFTIISLVKVVAVFILLYIFIPSRVIRFSSSEGFWDKVFISLVHSNFIIILFSSTILLNVYNF